MCRDVMEFQQQKRGCETLEELMSMPSTGKDAKVTVILNHFQRKTLCAQLDALLEQTLPFHEVWVMAFGSPQRDMLRAIVEAYNDTRISIVESAYDYKYYGRFQMALQVHNRTCPQYCNWTTILQSPISAIDRSSCGVTNALEMTC